MTLDHKAAMVVLSGGQDSTTCLAWALDRYDTVCAVTFDYGQRHDIELEAARDVRKYLEQKYNTVVMHEVILLGDEVLASTSPLVNKKKELETYFDFETMDSIIGDRIEKTFVPMRNALFLTIAANRAVAQNCAYLITGVCQADNANYPDCRQVFIDAMAYTTNLALGLSGDDALRILTPLMNLSKAESIKLAQRIPHAYDALAFSHTAYDGKYPPTGNDHASILRAHGFEEAGVPDPLVVRAWRQGLMDLPGTQNYEGVR